MITTPTNAAVGRSLSQLLADKQLPQAEINRLAGKIAINGAAIKKISLCSYGICVDYFTPNKKVLDGIIRRPGLGSVEVFPYGIVAPDLFLAKARLNLNGL